MKRLNVILLIINIVTFLISSFNLYEQYSMFKNSIADDKNAAAACYNDNSILQERNEELQNEIDTLEKEKVE